MQCKWRRLEKVEVTDFGGVEFIASKWSYRGRLGLAILLEVHFLWDRKPSLKSTQTEEHTKKTLSQASKIIWEILLLPLPFRLPTWGSSGELTCQCRRHSSVPGSGRRAGEGNGNPLQYFCLENPLDRWAWQAVVHGVPKSWMQLKPLSAHSCRRYRFYRCDSGRFYTRDFGKFLCTVSRTIWISKPWL